MCDALISTVWCVGVSFIMNGTAHRAGELKCSNAHILLRIVSTHKSVNGPFISSDNAEINVYNFFLLITHS